MPIEVSCPSCNARMRVPDTAAGKKVRCPKCQQGVINVPAAAGGDAPTIFAPTSPVKAQQKLSTSGATSTPKTTPKTSTTKAKVENWTMQTDDGQTYGPVPKTELDSWHAEGRVTAECQLLKEGADQWQWASEVYPDLAAEGAAASGSAPAAAEGGGGGGDGSFDFLGGGGGGGHGAPAAEGGAFDFGAPAAGGGGGEMAPAAASTSPSKSKGKGAKGKGGKGKGKARKAEDGEVGQRSKMVAGLLGIFLGGWGVHNFYLGFTKKAIIQIVVTVCTLCMGGIWGFVEGIMIFMGKIDRDADGFLLKD